MKIMKQIYEKHAVACVWFIKYMTENVIILLTYQLQRSILEELLLANNKFEVRENFANLLITAINVTAKNEESYFDEVLI